jgi:8-oxo-dGTP pyrophosphatase MutT (NUDIX family)
MTIIAGIFLIRKNNKILVCHPTKHSKNFWSIPKGRVEDNEEILETAIRETFEETNIDVAKWKVIHSLEPIEYDTDKKILHSFAIFEKENPWNFDKFEIKCNSNVAPEKGGFPEMDDFKWVATKEAKGLFHTAQMKALEELEYLIKKIEKQTNKTKY